MLRVLWCLFYLYCADLGNPVKRFFRQVFTTLFFIIINSPHSGYAQKKQHAWYVSPSGKDSNKGTISSPFQTLEKARNAARQSNIKNIYLRGGVYRRSETFILTEADNGTNWSLSPGDQANSAILDGSGIPDIVDILGGSNITIRGLTIRNYTSRGIGIHGGQGRSLPTPFFDRSSVAAKGNTIIHNIIENGTIKTPCWERAGINIEGCTPNTIISRNLVRNTTGYGIGAWALQKGDDISGLRIEGNVILNCGSSVEDGGAIYIIDPYSVNHRSSFIYIKNNFIRDYGTLSNNTRGIYIDNETSFTVVDGNIVCGKGSQPFIYHGGSHIKVTRNIFDLGASGQMSAFWHVVFNDNKMLHNTFTNNVILSSYPETTRFPAYVKYGDTAEPEIRNNLYFNYSGGAVSTGGNLPTLYDSSSLSENPQISGAEYNIAPNSPLYTKLGFPRKRGSYGPQGYKIPAKGSQASCMLKSSNAGIILQAERYSSMKGIVPTGTTIEYCDNDDWLIFQNTDFGKGVNRFTAHVAVFGDLGGQYVEVRLNGPDGKLVGRLKTSSMGTNGEFRNQSTMLTEPIKGIRTICIRFAGHSGVGNFDFFRFD